MSRGDVDHVGKDAKSENEPTALNETTNNMKRKKESDVTLDGPDSPEDLDGIEPRAAETNGEGRTSKTPKPCQVTLQTQQTTQIPVLRPREPMTIKRIMKNPTQRSMPPLMIRMMRGLSMSKPTVLRQRSTTSLQVMRPQTR